MNSSITTAAGEHEFDRLVRFVGGFGDDDAFACGEAVGLDYHRHPETRHVGERRILVIMPGIGRSRDILPRAQILHKALRPFQLRSLTVGAEHGDFGDAQRGSEAVHQRTFWPDDDQFDIIFVAKGDDGAVIRHVKRHELRLFGNAGVARRGVECIAER